MERDSGSVTRHLNETRQSGATWAPRRGRNAAGADLRSTNRYGGTALIPAAHHGHVEVVREMLATKVDIDHVNRLGWTALVEAVILGDGGKTHTEIVGLLLAAGADPRIADRDGVTPLAHAKRRGYSDMAKLLEAAENRKR